MHSIAIFGLGIIGSRIAQHLSQEGLKVTVWNRSPKVEFPNMAQSPQEATKTNQTLAFYLKDKAACLTLFQTIKGELRPEHTILNHSTIDLATVRTLSAACQEIGCTYVDAPFTGSKLAAAKGELTYYVGTSPETYEKVLPLLTLSSKARIHTGEIGSACILKLVTNLIQVSTIQAICEAHAITSAHDITSEKLIEAIQLNLVSSALVNFKLPLIAAGNFETHFSLDNMRKDSTYAIAAAEEKGITPPCISLISQIMTQLCEQGHSEEDFTCLAKNLR